MSHKTADKLKQGKDAHDVSLPSFSDIVIKIHEAIGEHGLDELSLDALAEACSKKLSEKNLLKRHLKKLFPHNESMVHGIFYDVILRFEASHHPQKGEIKEILFDGIMDYLDQLAIHKPSFSKVFRATPQHPHYVTNIIQHLNRTIRHILLKTEHAFFLQEKVGAFLLFFVIPAWMDDDSLDQSKTMAALDQGLEKVL